MLDFEMGPTICNSVMLTRGSDVVEFQVRVALFIRCTVLVLQYFENHMKVNSHDFKEKEWF